MISTKKTHFTLVFAFFLLFLAGRAQSTFSKYFVFAANSQMNTSTFTNCHQLSHQNGYLLTAEIYTSQNIRNTMLIRTDTVLHETWSTMLDFSNAAQPFDNIFFTDVGELLNGNYFLFGEAAVAGSPYYVVFILDTIGNVLHYTALHDSINSSNNAVIPEMRVAFDSSLIITLSEYEKFGFYRLDQNLNVISSAVYSNNMGYSWGRGGMLLADTTILFPGDSGGLVLTKMELNGNNNWSYRYPGIGRCYDICQSATGSVYIAGATVATNGNSVSYAAKISLSGQLLWYKTFNMVNGLTMSGAWNIYPNGNNLVLYSDSIMFEIDTLGSPVGTGFTVNSNNYKVMKPCSGNDFMLAGPIFQFATQSYRHTVIRFNMSTISGCLQSRGIIATTATSVRLPMALHPLPHLIQSSAINFSGSAVQMDYDVLNGCPVTFNAISENRGATQALFVFPNPASDALNVHYEPKDQEAMLSFELTDVSGRIVKSEQVSMSAENEFRLSVLSVAEGIYTISIYENGNVMGHKLCVVKH